MLPAINTIPTNKTPPARIAPHLAPHFVHQARLRDLLRRYRAEERKLVKELEHAQSTRDQLDHTLRLRMFTERDEAFLDQASMGWTSTTERIESLARDLVHLRDTLAGVSEELARSEEVAA
jgi:hypothetical protein